MGLFSFILVSLGRFLSPRLSVANETFCLDRHLVHEVTSPVWDTDAAILRRFHTNAIFSKRLKD